MHADDPLAHLRGFDLTGKQKHLYSSERDDPKAQAKRRRYRSKVRRIEAKRLVQPQWTVRTPQV